MKSYHLLAKVGNISNVFPTFGKKKNIFFIFPSNSNAQKQTAPKFRLAQLTWLPRLTNWRVEASFHGFLSFRHHVPDGENDMG